MNAIEFVEMLNNRVRNSVVSIVESDLESPNCNYPNGITQKISTKNRLFTV